MGPDGEMVLLAVTSGHRLLSTPRVLAFGSDYIAAHDQMWDLLELLDPPTENAPQRALQAI